MEFPSNQLEKNNEKDEVVNKIKIFSSKDEKLKMLGEVFSNKSSRDIIQLLTDKECYVNEIADKLNLRPNLVIYHLKKLEELDLLSINEKQIVKNGINHKHFKMMQNIFISSNLTKLENGEKGILKKIFRDSVKFCSLVIIGLTSWYGFDIIFNLNAKANQFNLNTFDTLSPIIISFIIVVGLTFFLNKRRKKSEN